MNGISFVAPHPSYRTSSTGQYAQVDQGSAELGESGGKTDSALSEAEEEDEGDEPSGEEGCAEQCLAPENGQPAWCWLFLVFLLVVALIVVDLALNIHRKLLQKMITYAVYFRQATWSVWWRWLQYIGVYIFVSLTCIPLTPFEIFTGFCFGVPFGLCLDLVGRLSGAAIAFAIARILACWGVNCNRCCGTTVLRGVGLAVEEQGLRFMVLFNLAYVPVAVKNYGLGFVPEVDIWRFLLAILIVEIPMALIWSSVGSFAAQRLEADGITFDNVTAVEEELSEAKGGTSLRICLLAVALVSIVCIIEIVRHKVVEEIGEVHKRASQTNLGVEDGVPTLSEDEVGSDGL